MKNTIQAFGCFGSRMNLKLFFLHSHLAYFPKKLGAVNDEHEERFSQDIAIVEKRYHRKSNCSIMGNIVGFNRNRVKQNILALESMSKDNRLGIVF